MFSHRNPVNLRESGTAVMLRRLLFGNWRAWVALVTVLAFVSILAIAATHHHASTAEDQACTVCSVAVQKITDTPLVDLPEMVAVLFFYALFVAESRVIAHVISLYLPPSCGPPRRSPAIC